MSDGMGGWLTYLFFTYNLSLFYPELGYFYIKIGVSYYDKNIKIPLFLIRCHNRQTERACFPTMLCSVSIFFVSCFSAVSCSCGGANSYCIFLSNAASSALRPFSSSSFFQVLPAISSSCGISFSKALHLESYCSM